MNIGVWESSSAIENNKDQACVSNVENYLSKTCWWFSPKLATFSLVHRSAVLDVLGTCGLKDDFENLSTELDTWDAAWDMEPTQRHTRHKQMSRDALDT